MKKRNLTALAILAACCFAGARLGADDLSAADHLSMAQEYLDDADSGQAESEAREALKLEPGLEAAWALLGRALAAQGKDKSALEALDKAGSAAEKGDLGLLKASLKKKLGLDAPKAKPTEAASPTPVPTREADVRIEEAEPEKTGTPVKPKKKEPEKAPEEAEEGGGDFRPKKFTLLVGSFLGYEAWFDKARDLGSGNPADKVLGSSGTNGTIDVSAAKERGDFPMLASLGFDHWVLEFASVSFQAPVRYLYSGPQGTNPDTATATGHTQIFGAGYDWAFFSRRSGAASDFEAYLPLRVETINMLYKLDKFQVSDNQFGGSLGIGLRWHPASFFAVDAGANYHMAIASANNFDYGNSRVGTIAADGFMIRFGAVGAF